MDTQEKAKQEPAGYTPLEVPEIVPGAPAVDFPEISDFLKSMKLKGSLFGFQKEDVYEKMQKLNSMYQTRAQQLRDQARRRQRISGGVLSRKRKNLRQPWRQSMSS